MFANGAHSSMKTILEKFKTFEKMSAYSLEKRSQ